MSTTEDRTVTHNPELSRYEIYLDGALAGFADYVHDGETMRIPHTEIDPAFGGRGAGSALVRGTIEGAQHDGVTRILPECPFVKSWLEKHPEFDGLWR